MKVNCSCEEGVGGDVVVCLGKDEIKRKGSYNNGSNCKEDDGRSSNRNQQPRRTKLMVFMASRRGRNETQMVVTLTEEKKWDGDGVDPLTEEDK